VNALLRWIEVGLKERTHTTSAVLFALATVPMLSMLWGLQAYPLSDPETRLHYHADTLQAAQHLLTALIIWQVGIAAYAWMTRERADEHRPLLAFWTVTPTLLVLTLLSIGYGLKDTPMGMVVVEELVVARALFVLRDVRASLVLGALMLVGYEWGMAHALVGDAPMLVAPVFVGRELDPWWGLWLRVVLYASVWPFSMGVFFLFASMARYRSDLETLARTDMLTGLANRREFMAKLTEEAHRQARSAQACSLVMLDIDHFKRINDEHGHPAGDAVLAQVGRMLRSGVREKVDVAARVGGEEFALLLPETDLQGASRVAHKLLAALKNHAFEYQGQTLNVTLSAGVAEVEGGRGELALRAADVNLYAATQAGRDRVVAATV
jgi:diguanylate cyclase (GGDEF)-like protein